MPFFPMRPKPGSPLRNDKQVEQVLQHMDEGRWVIQPKLGGQRLCLAVVDKRIWVQNRHGRWADLPENANDFLRLPDRTCLDGELLKGSFHPFECLAVKGQSLIFKPTSERATVAYQLVKLLGHRWLFNAPSKKFLKARRANLPLWEGVVLKDFMAYYIMLGKETQTSQNWIKRKW